MSTTKKKVEKKIDNKNTTLSKSPMLSEKLKFFKLNDTVQLPTFATRESACFDICANLVQPGEIQYYQAISTKSVPRQIAFDINNSNTFIQLNNMERMLIPTGLIADIPKGFSVRLHSRSGLAFKQGVYLANCEGIIDSDYVDPIFAMVTNISNVPVRIYNGDRICQGELVRCEKYTLDESDEAPTQKTDREGGFGSTGT
jgi:dUTP pyrophosphatase